MNHAVRSSGRQTSLSVVLFIFLFLLSFQVKAQSANDITGTWLNQEKEGRIEIYRQESKFFGKIIWLNQPNENGHPKTDKNNPHESKRDQPIIGLVFLQNFEFSNNKWENGKIYDPRDGKTYNCTLTLIDRNKLKVRGFIGYSWMGVGKTNIWTRVN